MTTNAASKKDEWTDYYQDFFDNASDKADQAHDDLAALEKELEDYSKTDRDYYDEARTIAHKIYCARELLQDAMYDIEHIESIDR